MEAAMGQFAPFAAAGAVARRADRDREDDDVRDDEADGDDDDEDDDADGVDDGEDLAEVDGAAGAIETRLVESFLARYLAAISGATARSPAKAMNRRTITSQ